MSECSPQTLRARLAAYFQARPWQWIPAADLIPLGGLCAWRTRISDLRQPRYGGMQIDNETRTARRADGSAYKVSFYRYVPAQSEEIAS